MTATATQRPSREAIMAGEPFRYDVVGYGSSPEAALRDAQHWQAHNGSRGAGSDLYGRTVPVRWGEPVPAGPWLGGWRVPCWWAVAS